jgi:nucleoid-associated protein YgaU
MKLARVARLAATAAAFAALSAATGCAWINKPKPAASATPAVTNVKPLAVTTVPPPQPVIVQPVQPVPVQPVVSDASPVVTPVTASHTSSPTASAGTTYTVQKGDTISKIARAKYGDLSAVRRIKQANPGIDPNNIKTGQKIMLP